MCEIYLNDISRFRIDFAYFTRLGIYEICYCTLSFIFLYFYQPLISKQSNDEQPIWWEAQDTREGQHLHLRKVAQLFEMYRDQGSKFENGERQLQSHMLNGLSELFDLDYKEMQIQLLNQRLNEQFGDEPYFNEAIYKLVKNKKGYE